MHKCMVCGNTSNNTKINSPGVNYHGIPKSTYFMRRKWLKVNGIDRFRDWQHICNKHFLEKNYNPEKKQFFFSNTIPQPYDGNGIREEHIGNIPSTSSFVNRWVFNSNEIPSSSSSNYVANVESNKTPFSSDTTSSNAKDLTLKKMLIEKHEIKTDPAEICGTHFGLDRFMDTKLERLKPGAVSSLFLDKNITNTKKIRSASTFVKNWRSYSNDVTSVEPKNNLVIFLNSTKDVEFYCSVPQCITNTLKEATNLCLYAPTMERLKKWSEILGVHLTPTSLVCARHFRLQDFQRATTLSIKNMYKVLDQDALPVPMNDVPVLSRCEDTFKSIIDNEVDEQSSEKENNVKDNTSMTIDLTIDDSSNSSLSVTLEPTT